MNSILSNQIEKLKKEEELKKQEQYLSLHRDWVENFAPSKMSLHDKSLLTGQTVYDVLRNGTHTMAWIKNGVLFKALYNFKHSIDLNKALVGKDGYIDIDPREEVFAEENRQYYRITDVIGVKDLIGSHIRVDEQGVAAGCKFKLTLVACAVTEIEKTKTRSLSVLLDTFSDTQTGKVFGLKGTTGDFYETGDLNLKRPDFVKFLPSNPETENTVKKEFKKIEDLINEKTTQAPIVLRKLLRLE